MTPINQGGMFNMGNTSANSQRLNQYGFEVTEPYLGNTSANSFTKSRNEFEDIYATAPMANASNFSMGPA